MGFPFIGLGKKSFFISRSIIDQDCHNAWAKRASFSFFLKFSIREKEMGKIYLLCIGESSRRRDARGDKMHRARARTVNGPHLTFDESAMQDGLLLMQEVDLPRKRSS